MNQPPIPPATRADSARPDVAASTVERGTCYVFFAYDVGLSIDLDEAARHITTTREIIKHQHKAPRHFGYHPSPLRFRQATTPVELGAYRSTASVDSVIYDFGAVSVTYQVPLNGPFGGLVDLSERLYENSDLLADSRSRVEQLLLAMRTAVKKPQISELVEDFVIYHVQELAPRMPVEEWIAAQAALIAQILRSEKRRLSHQEIEDALSFRIAFTDEDVTIIDWQGALSLQEEAEDVAAVLEFANVELLEMRFLDDRLDTVLDRSYEALSRAGRRSLLLRPDADLRRIASLQMDSALLFEGVNNTLKLLGDQYLARVYRLASQRLHLAEWDASILRKLGTVESIYEKVRDFQTTRRMEILEWIIIALIAISTALSLIPGLGRH